MLALPAIPENTAQLPPYDAVVPATVAVATAGAELAMYAEDRSPAALVVSNIELRYVKAALLVIELSGHLAPTASGQKGLETLQACMTRAMLLGMLIFGACLFTDLFCVRFFLLLLLLFFFFAILCELSLQIALRMQYNGTGHTTPVRRSGLLFVYRQSRSYAFIYDGRRELCESAEIFLQLLVMCPRQVVPFLSYDVVAGMPSMAPVAH